MNCNLRFCVRHHYDKEYQGVPHAHPCWEIVFYCHGKGEVKIGKNSYEFFKDTFSVIPPKATHTERGEKGTEVLYIGFDILSDERLNEGVYSEKEYCILYYLENIFKESRGLDLNRYSANVVDLLTQLIVCSLLREKSREVKQDKSEIVRQAKAYVSENYMHDIDVRTIAKSVGYSYDYLRHVFFEVERITVREYILQERLNNAKEMLLSGRFQVKEIAAASGFSSLSHFCFIFKKHTGKTPQDFAKNNMVFTKMLYAKADEENDKKV